MPTVSLSLLGGAAAQFFDDNGNPLSGGKLYTYAAGTSTPKTTYPTSAGTGANPNPIVLNAAGRFSEIWLVFGDAYKFVLYDSADTLIGSWDDIVGGSVTSLNADQIPYTPAGTGANVTDVQAKLRQYVSIKDFGAVGDGSADDTNPWKEFVNHLAANGGEGLLNEGTYLVDGWALTLLLNAPFTIRGEGKDVSILKRRGSVVSGVLNVSSGSNITLTDFTIDNNYTGDPASATDGATLSFYNANYITLRNIRFKNPWRTACLVHNDWQTQQLIKYSHIVIDGCDVFANSAAYTGGDGPSAFLLADVNDSQITNCYIENIGLYGYEFKNDCSRTLIDNCIAKNTYYPYYYGGDGDTALGFVKESQISNCIAISAREAFACGYASNNKVNNLLVDNTNTTADTDWDSYYTIDIRNSSNNNTITNVTAVNPNSTGAPANLVNINPPGGTGNPSFNNRIEISNIYHGTDTTSGGIGDIPADCTGNTIIFGNRDSDQQMFTDAAVIGENTVIDQKLHRSSLSAGTSELIKTRLGDGADDIPAASNGVAWVGVQDEFWSMASGATQHVRYVGDTTKYDEIAEVYTISPTNSKTLDLAPGGPVPTYVWEPTAFYPGADNTVALGGASNRWLAIYAKTVYVTSDLLPEADNTANIGSAVKAWKNEWFVNAPTLTSDGNKKQQIRELSVSEKAVAARLKLLIRAYKFNDSVAEKGDGARIHVGVIAQDVKVAFESEGLDAGDYGMFCSDTVDGVDHLGIRYEELLAFVISAM